MNKCKRVGLEITKRCNWRCTTCFYRWQAGFNEAYDVPLAELCGQMDAAKTRGCEHAVVVGWGEPVLYKELPEINKEATARDMTSSIITNGSAAPDTYQKLFDAGINHLHISAHGVGATLDAIA